MNMVTIAEAVEHLRRTYHEPDPFKLCYDMRILLAIERMGTYEGACKGFFLSQSRKRMIVVNGDLPYSLQRIIVAHELGHAVLHRKDAKIKTFHDFSLFDNTSRFEYEANVFAAEYLMPDEDVLDRLNDDVSFFGAAALLGVPAELLDFKFRVLKRKGYKVMDPPLLAQGNFLKNVEVEGLGESEY